MLTDCPGVVGIDETHIGHHLGVWRAISLAWATSEQDPELTTYREIKRSHPDYLLADRYRHVWEPALARLLEQRLRAQVSETAPGEPDPLVMIKEPGGSEVADLLLPLLPEAKLIFLLRDGRDVVDSWLDAYRAGTWAIDEGTYSLRPEARMPFIRWQASVWAFRTRAVHRAYDQLPVDRRAFLRYEDLVREPEQELATLTNTLQLDVSAKDIRAIVERHRYWGVPREERGRGHRIRWAEPGRWRVSMSDDEAAAMAEIMDPILAGYDYPPTLSSAGMEDL